ncbi:MAG TPA: PIN domain-containing protein [Pyrinomonadaceae bacterium]|jgi:predicted nucleic acid-binding protein
MRVLFDSDVVLDLLLDRAPFARDAAALFELHERGRLDGYVSGVTVVNVFYVTRKLKGIDAARPAVGELLKALGVCPVDRHVLAGARRLAFSDYEDAVRHACAEASGLDAVVTRNLEDYKNAALPVFSPGGLLKHLQTTSP